MHFSNLPKNVLPFLLKLSTFTFFTLILLKKNGNFIQIVDCKLPFAAPQHVIRYLGRYTYKVAISNHRIIDIAGDNVTFSAKDYRHGNRKITIEMNQQEFIRRFALHILPKGFVRNYGILCSSKKGEIIPELQQIIKRVFGFNVYQCPVCKKGTMRKIKELPRIRSPNNDLPNLLLLKLQ